MPESFFRIRDLETRIEVVKRRDEFERWADIEAMIGESISGQNVQVAGRNLLLAARLTRARP